MTCPTCRAEHRAVAAATDFPISYGIEELISHLKATNVTPEASARPRQSRTGGLLQVLVKDQESSMARVDNLHQEVEEQLELYEAKLDEWLENHQQQVTELNKLVEKHNATIAQVEEEKAKLMTLKGDIVPNKTKRQGIKTSLSTVSTTQETFLAMDEAMQSNSDTEEWINKCREDLPNIKIIQQSQKVPCFSHSIPFQENVTIIIIPLEMSMNITSY